MKHKEFIDKLKAQGVRIVEGKNHCKAYFRGKQMVILRHPAKDYPPQYLKIVQKQLGL